MCIAVFLWQAHPLYPFLVLNNRDEYHNRPTKEASWWEDMDIVGGRDEVGGGTWLACSRQGRVAFLTNVLELHTNPQAKTRGYLPLQFLKSKESPREFAERLKGEGGEYNGFNLIVGDIGSKSMYYISNRPNEEEGIIDGGTMIKEVTPGLHVLSNANLDSPWHKAQRLRLRFTQEIAAYGHDSEIPLKHIVDQVMKDTLKADPSLLPHICSLDWEFNLSSIFVHVHTPLGVYGTRSTTALAVTSGGEVSFYELYLDTSNTSWKDHLIKFQIQKESTHHQQFHKPQTNKYLIPSANPSPSPLLM